MKGRTGREGGKTQADCGSRVVSTFAPSFMSNPPMALELHGLIVMYFEDGMNGDERGRIHQDVGMCMSIDYQLSAPFPPRIIRLNVVRTPDDIQLTILLRWVFIDCRSWYQGLVEKSEPRHCGKYLISLNNLKIIHDTNPESRPVWRQSSEVKALPPELSRIPATGFWTGFW